MLDIAQSTLKAPVTKLGLRCLIVLAVIILLDQASKAWVLYGLRLPSHGPVTILPFFSFTYVQNTGMSFGLLGGGLFRWGLTLFQLAAGCALGYGASKQTKPLAGIALAFIAGGAIGNAIDRIRFGSVVDFIDFSGTHVFPWVFNVADSAITIGVALLAWYFLKSEGAAKDQASPQG
ncbi:signal peptidase II [Asticcacaulis solisilvae]|uniref:signal peptidase II n=1 Tax=Asticcacaulis solisilvae TaxID=1217274 RepID=UPI003FD846D7